MVLAMEVKRQMVPIATEVKPTAQAAMEVKRTGLVRMAHKVTQEMEIVVTE